MMKIPTCAFERIVIGPAQSGGIEIKLAVVQLAAVLHTTVVVIAPAWLEYPMRLNTVVSKSTLNNVTELLNIPILLDDG